MDRARAQRALEAINLAATGDSTALNLVLEDARAELEQAGWHKDMAPAAGLSGIGVPKAVPAEVEGVAHAGTATDELGPSVSMHGAEADPRSTDTELALDPADPTKTVVQEVPF